MIYFDNSATTPLCPEAKDAMTAAMEQFANPSSVHRAGFEAHQRLEEARKTVAKTLSCSPEEICFTSCGTEADNLALLGAVRALRRRGNTVITTDSEHPAVAETAKALEQEGLTLIRLKTRGGVLDLQEVKNAAAKGDVIAASLMHTNNETGAVYAVAEANRCIREANPNALIHCDCVQSYLKTPLSFSLLNADLISVSAHKIHGPKGVGALAVKKGVRIVPRLLGGGQEKALRSGTENTVGIAGFAAAAKAGWEGMQENAKRAREIKEAVCRGLRDHKKIFFNLPLGESSPYILSMQAQGYKSEVLLRMYSDAGICVSAGSACSAKTGKSPVLKAFGLSDREADCTLRLSFGAQNTLEEAEEFCRVTRTLVR